MSKFFVTCARGIEEVTEKELQAMGIPQTEKVPGGVFFEGDQEALYKAHLWLRTGNRILLVLRSFPCRDPEQLYENIYKFKWETFLKDGLTFAVDCTISGRKNPALSHSHYAKLKAKDAVVDRMRERTGDRPDVNPEDPDIGIVLYIRDGVCTLNLDATGDSLHERGYRSRHAEAPLKETLAAGILQLMDWDRSSPLLDPMCGSGTLLSEAALLARNVAPGILRARYSFMNWPDYYEPRWERLFQEAENARKPMPKNLLFGFDHNPDAIKQTKFAAKILGVEDSLSLGVREFHQLMPPEGISSGTIVMNPPYGDRIGEVEELKPLYKHMGDTFKQKFKGWRAGVFTGSSELAKVIGLKPTRRFPLWNGPIECRLLTFDLY